MTKLNDGLDTTRNANHSSFLAPTLVGGRRPLASEICAQSDPSHFEKRRLKHISAYNVSTVRDSERSSTMTNTRNVAINDVLPLKAARRDAIVNLKCFGGLGHQRPNFDGYICIHYTASPYSARISAIYLLPFV